MSTVAACGVEELGEVTAAIQLQPPPTPADEVPQTLDKDAWLTRWDNPPVVGRHTLRQHQDNAIAAAITACQDAQDKRGLQVVVTGSLDNETGQGVNCSPLTLGATTENGSRVIVTSRGLFAKGTLSHELGHALGIKAHSQDLDNLMYASEVPASPRLLTPADCGIARERAAGLQATVW